MSFENFTTRELDYIVTLSETGRSAFDISRIIGGVDVAVILEVLENFRAVYSTDQIRAAKRELAQAVATSDFDALPPAPIATVLTKPEPEVEPVAEEKTPAPADEEHEDEEGEDYDSAN